MSEPTKPTDPSTQEGLGFAPTDALSPVLGDLDGAPTQAMSAVPGLEALDAAAEGAPTQAMTSIPDMDGAPTEAMTAVPERDVPADVVAARVSDAQPKFGAAADDTGSSPSASSPQPRLGDQGPGGPTRGGGPMHGPRSPMAPPPEKKFGFSAALNFVGALLILVSFFMPTVGIPYLNADGNSLFDMALAITEVSEDEDIDEELGNADEVIADVIESVDYGEFITAMEEAEDEDEQVGIVQNYYVSSYQMMRFAQIVDFNHEVFPEARDDLDGLQAVRILWLFFSWFGIVALIALGVTLARGFKPLNAFQVGWAGMFGLLFITMGLALTFAEETKEMGDITVHLFGGSGPGTLLVGSIILWISAFTGITGDNWWKAPLLGLLGFGVLLGLSALLVVTV